MDKLETIKDEPPVLAEIVTAFKDSPAYSQNEAVLTSNDWDQRHFGNDLSLFIPYVTDAAHFVESMICYEWSLQMEHNRVENLPDWLFINSILNTSSGYSQTNSPSVMHLLFRDIDNLTNLPPNELYLELRNQILLSQDELILVLALWGSRRSIRSRQMIKQPTFHTTNGGNGIVMDPSPILLIDDLSDFHLMELIDNSGIPRMIKSLLKTSRIHKCRRAYRRLSTVPDKLHRHAPWLNKRTILNTVLNEY